MLLELQTIMSDTPEGGAVSVIEAAEVLPFRVERAYHIFGVKAGVVRGHHAHKTLSQLLICVSGVIEVTLDNGSEKRNFILDRPSLGLLVGPGEWRTMAWLRDDSVLTVLASSGYDEGDYIRDYGAFLKWNARGAEDRR